MMSFQGSDWCAACKRLEKSFFDSEEFQTFANQNLVLLKLDFPMKKENKLSKEQTAHNEALADQYNPEGIFPRVFFFNSQGEILGELTTPQKSPEDYINQIKSMLK